MEGGIRIDFFFSKIIGLIGCRRRGGGVILSLLCFKDG